MFTLVFAAVVSLSMVAIVALVIGFLAWLYKQGGTKDLEKGAGALLALAQRRKSTGVAAWPRRLLRALERQPRRQKPDEPD